MRRKYTVSEAYYLVGKDPIWMPGIPGYNGETYGEYTGDCAIKVAGKAFTSLQGYMKKHYKEGWFQSYNPEKPPVIVFKLVDKSTLESNFYMGVRVPHHQGLRTVVNKDGRVREYKWDNEIIQLKQH